MISRFRNLDRLRSVSRAYKIAVAKGDLFRLRKRFAYCLEEHRDLRMSISVQREALADARRVFGAQPKGWIDIPGISDGGENGHA